MARVVHQGGWSGGACGRIPFGGVNSGVINFIVVIKKHTNGGPWGGKKICHGL